MRDLCSRDEKFHLPQFARNQSVMNKISLFLPVFLSSNVSTLFVKATLGLFNSFVKGDY